MRFFKPYEKVPFYIAAIKKIINAVTRGSVAHHPGFRLRLHPGYIRWP